MSENKNLNSPETEDLTEEIQEEEETVAEVSQEQSPEELDKELEEIRDCFQQELDKAKARAETEPEEETAEDDLAEDEDDSNLCLCCGEKEKMEGSDYCEDCYEAMRHYPFKWAYFLVALLIVYVGVLAINKIGDINAGWVYAYQGDVLASEGYFKDASEKYQYAQNYLYRSKVEPKMVYSHALETSYKSGGFNVISVFPTSVATLFEEWELNLPYMKNLKKDYMRSQEMLATVQKINDEILADYAYTSVEDLPYDEVIKKISSLETLTLHIGLDDDGNEIAEPTTEEYSGKMTSSNEVYYKRTTKYDTATIQCFKFLLARACNRPNKERMDYLLAVKANAPDMLWLYAGDLGLEYVETGDREKALECADMIYNWSMDDIDSYYIKALVAKKMDHKFDDAIKYCEDGNIVSENMEFYYELALNYLAKGDYKKAQENAQLAFDNNTDGKLDPVNLLAFCAIANKDEDKFQEIEKAFDDYNANLEKGAKELSLSKSVIDLRSGKKTVNQILEQGGYDLYD